MPRVAPAFCGVFLLIRKSINIPKTALQGLDVTYDDFHGDWNYTIAPQESANIQSS